MKVTYSELQTDFFNFNQVNCIRQFNSHVQYKVQLYAADKTLGYTAIAKIIVETERSLLL